MDENFVCPICMEYAEEAVETNCCHNIFCNKCLGGLKDASCPTCRAKKPKFSTEVSHLARRIIGCMEITCIYDGCGSTFPRSEQKGHELKCVFKPYSCPQMGCTFSGVSEVYLAHLITEHKSALLQNSSQLFKSSDDSNVTDTEIDRIKTTFNHKKEKARLGESGKYYCAMHLDGPNCNCCNRYCGPTNGCNCSACMKLDVYVRRLPKNWLVNREGAACRKGTTGKYYCGRKVMIGDRRTDGYCGPTNGNNCYACQKIDEQKDGRYANIWS